MEFKPIKVFKWSLLGIVAISAIGMVALSACAPNSSYETRDEPKERVVCWSNGVEIMNIEVEWAYAGEGVTMWIPTRTDREKRYSTADCLITPLRDSQ